MSTWGRSVDPTAMRCPRCLEPWSADYVDLGAENAHCPPCDLTVALLGLVVPETARFEVVDRLERLGDPPPLGSLEVSETFEPERRLAVRSGAGFFSSGARFELDRRGVRSRRPFQAANELELAQVRRIVPAVFFTWDRDSRSDEKGLMARARVTVLGPEDDAPSIEAETWDAARWVAARAEAVRRALSPTGIYR